MADKYVYFFGKNQVEGNKDMKDILGGKGANLAEMAGIGLPVPQGFTVSTEVCKLFAHLGDKIPFQVEEEILVNMKKLEEASQQKFGSEENPLLYLSDPGQSFPCPE